MNRIEIRNSLTSSGYETKAFFVEVRSLYEDINEWLSNNSELLE